MCSGFFSCMDQKQITFQKNITALGELLAQEESGGHSASQVLTLADAAFSCGARDSRQSKRVV